MSNGVIYYTRRKDKEKITIKYDMGWQKRSTYRSYDYSIRRAFIIGGIYKGIIGVVVYQNCQKSYDSEYKRVEETDDHDLPKNIQVKSKIMDTDKIMNMS